MHFKRQTQDRGKHRINKQKENKVFENISATLLVLLNKKCCCCTSFIEVLVSESLASRFVHAF